MNTLNIIFACISLFILVFSVILFITRLARNINDSKYMDVFFISLGTIGLFLSCIL